jgi:hypothetical protein
MMWTVSYFVVATHQALPAFTTGPMSREDAEFIASQHHPGIYAIVRPAAPLHPGQARPPPSHPDAPPQ